MKLLHNIKEGPTPNYDSPEVVEAWLKANPEEPISFDGVYKSVWDRRDLFLKYPRYVILFPIGFHVGKNNAWDASQPLEEFCTWQQILDLMFNYDCELGWHSWAHRDLTALDDKELAREVTPPMKGITSFAYPYGKYDERVVQAVSDAGYSFAYGTSRADGLTPLTKPRLHIQTYEHLKK